MANPFGYHVLTRDGDGTGEIEAALRTAGSPQSAGLHKYFYVARANQTVVMATSPDAAIAVALRGLPGWREPVDDDVD